MRSALWFLIAIAISCPLAIGQELTEQQMGPWKALETQINLAMKRNWDEETKFLHPKLSIWGDSIPSPIAFSGAANDYFSTLMEADPKPLAHHLVPVSVVVVDDVAIINAYLHILTKQDDKPKEIIYRLHNTWKREGERWQLLATYNTTVSSPGDDD